MEEYVEDHDWDEDFIEETSLQGANSLVVYSRDWTVETIVNQIRKGNIDLNPKFQRRNAWNDKKRSALIESLIIGLPVPEIVLAEDPQKKSSFIVIDGKQRLLTIAGFIDPEKTDYWQLAYLSGLKVRKDLNQKTYEELSTSGRFADDLRQLMNADIRCTVISNFSSDDVLYDIFYRLNTGSVPLSMQELRHVLHKGEFTDYLLEVTDTPQPIHSILGLEGPDNRLRDAELILRLVAIEFFGGDYTGNLRKFLDDSLEKLNLNWEYYESKVGELYIEINKATNLLKKILGDDKVGRKYVGGKWENRFNKVLFEVEVHYFMHLAGHAKSKEKNETFVHGFKQLSDKNNRFRRSIESTTKTNKNYETRFKEFGKLVEEVYGIRGIKIPIKDLKKK